MRTQVHLLPGGRLHFHDGPIDLIIEAFGTRNAINHAYQAASVRFITVLDELCQELPLLRQHPVDAPKGQIPRSMYAAVLPYAQDHFITPMAAVAGAVAEEVLRSMTAAANLTRAYVNNGGDIALHLAPGESFTTGMINRPDQPALFGTATIHYHEPIRGIATSGWRGRSFSLGIADAVTVLAATAAQADAATTIIANAVDLPNHPAVTRVPANSLAPDSDLGSRPVTQAVGQLTAEEIAVALGAGAIVAHQLIVRGLIHSAALNLSGETQTVGTTYAHVGAAALGRPPEKIPA
jgi:ApbE superfamily uncharacterized protein (UPF0280 family)